MRGRIVKSILCLGLALGILLCGCAEQPVTETRLGLLDTVVTVRVYSRSDKAVFDGIFSEVERYDALFSATAGDNDLSLLKENAGGEVQKISDEVYDLLQASEEWSGLTGGVFDVTLGALIDLWDVSGGGHVPTEAELNKAMSLCGYEKLELSDGGARLAEEGMSISLGAVAKGYIADRLREYIAEQSVEHALVSLGGNVLCIGGKPDGSPFSVGVRDPHSADGGIIGAVSITDGSVVSSGSYERYFEADGVRYHHIIDPGTGAPAQSGLAGVTMIGMSSEACDVLSTAVFILGAEKGMELVESLNGLECVLVTDGGEILLSSGAKEIFTEKENSGS